MRKNVSHYLRNVVVKTSKANRGMPISYVGRRVLVHELGHYLGHIINKRNWRPKIRSIKVFPSKHAPNDCEGRINFGKYVYKRLRRKRYRSAYIASLYYGCIVEAIYVGCSLNDCLDDHGADDIASRNSLVRDYSDRAVITKIANAHFSLLSQNSELKTTVSRLATMQDDMSKAGLIKSSLRGARKALISLFPKILPVYDQFVDGIYNIIK